MYFNRSNRIRTQPKIAGRLDSQFFDNKRKLKIKNIRFSLEHQSITQDETDKPAYESKDNHSYEFYKDKQAFPNRKKLLFTEKLPDLPAELKQGKKDSIKQTKNLSFQHKKKAAFLNSILEILNPNNQTTQNAGLFEKQSFKQIRKNQFMRAELNSKEYKNQFFQETTPQSNTKYYRSPKIIDSEIFKFNNNNNIARRKIFSEDKERFKGDKTVPESIKSNQSQDLQKIEILTFSNKFPLFRKEQSRIT